MTPDPEGLGPIKPWDVPLGSLRQDWFLLLGIVMGQVIAWGAIPGRTILDTLMGFVAFIIIVFSIRGLVVMYIIYHYNKNLEQ